MYDKLLRCVNSIRKKTDFVPQLALVLGSGLGGYADRIQTVATVPYEEINDFPISTVAGHNGRFVFGYVEGIPVVAMQGRVHYYEGYAMSDVVLPIRVMGMLGAKQLVLTNAAGGINEQFRAGDLMLITDHIATALPSPLLGKNLDALGTRFPDMTEVYSHRLSVIVQQTAEQLSIPLQHGVYVQLGGPQYETPAEVRMYRTLGGDAVGMSTACEAITARHMGLEVCGISCITNAAAGGNVAPLDHKDVQATADRVSETMATLLTHSIRSFYN